jgi:Lon protease-like protein
MMMRMTLVAAALAGGLAVPGAAWAQTAAPPATPRTTLPAVIPIFPLPDVVLFPGVPRPLLIFEPRYREMVADALKGDRLIGMVLLKPGYEANYEGRPPIYEIGCAGEITNYQLLPDGRYTILLRGLVKFRVTGEDQSKSYRLARVDVIPDTPKAEELAPLSALRERIVVRLLATLAPGADLPPSDLSDSDFINAVAQYLDIPDARRQELLELSGPLPRAQALLEMIETR